tara:strand:+ start:1118 stop:1342 length:225 start_codon:yes stop_codon:yes gene_type:complete
MNTPKDSTGGCCPPPPNKADSDKLTPAQIKNWRDILLGMLGPCALRMPDEDVQKMRDNIQAQFSEPNNQDHQPS